MLVVVSIPVHADLMMITAGFLNNATKKPA